MLLLLLVFVLAFLSRVEGRWFNPAPAVHVFNNVLMMSFT